MGCVNDVSGLKTVLRELQAAGAIDVHERVELRAWTTLRVGGPTDLMIRCNSVAAVSEVLDLLASRGQRYFILGAGSNVVLPDEGLRIPVLTLGGELSRWEIDLDGVVCGAGANLTQVCRSVARAGLSGIEQLFGVPGSVGGAIVMNAGAYGVEIFDVLEWVEIVRPGEGVRLVPARTIVHGYRFTHLDRRAGIVVRARLSLEPDDLSAIGARIREINVRRREKLPSQSSAGSVFKNPPDRHAGALLEAAGCKGLRVGGAQVSDRHANVIVTSRGASAADLLSLARKMRGAVAEKFGIELEPEVRFLAPSGSRIDL